MTVHPGKLEEKKAFLKVILIYLFRIIIVIVVIVMTVLLVINFVGKFLLIIKKE